MVSSLKFYLQSVSSDWDVLVRSDRERGVLAINPCTASSPSQAFPVNGLGNRKN